MTTTQQKSNIILELTFEFALEIIAYCEVLDLNKKYAISRQLIRSGTSIGANVRESQSAESKSDFVHKLKVSDKEAHETEYWLELCKFSQEYPNPDSLLHKLQSIKRLLNRIISSSKNTFQS